MEIVSNKLSLTAVSTALSSPSTSARHLERKATFSSSQRRWNGGTNSQRSSHGRRESLTGSSLMSLKAYYRKLRTFKGTIKALISFRRMPTFANRASVSGTSGAALPQHTEESSVAAVEGGASKTVAKLADDETALQTVQNQVKELVDKGHVVTELDPAGKEDVTYRLQGNLEHYTEENLRKRLKLQEHPHMVALTQRLWLAANHEEEAQLSFGEYEAYMLRLHRLILPEFDLAQSKQLIKDDWARDTDGSDHLDYRFFHFSMFELVDLWTDTVNAEDYISLLYCIMHCLTFKWNDRHILKDLDDVNPVDILEASKTLTKEEIERDLAQEVNSESAQMYRDRITCEDDEFVAVEDNGGTSDHQSGQSETQAGAATVPENASKGTSEKEDATSKTAPQRKPSASRNASSASDRRVPVVRTASSPSKAANYRTGKLSPRFSTLGGDATISGGAGTQIGVDGEAGLPATPGHDPNDAARTFSGKLSPRLPPGRLSGGANAGGTGSEFNVQGRQQGSGYGARGGSMQTGPRVIYSSGYGNQYGTGADGANSPISITSLGAGSEFINMVSKPGVVHKASMMGSGASFRQGDGSIGNAVFGLGLQAGQSAIAAGFAHHIEQDGDNFNMSAHASGGSFPFPGQSMSTSPRAPHPPQANSKESEARHGSRVGGEQLRSPPIVYGGGYGNSSPRARSAKSQARVSNPAAPQLNASSRIAVGSDAVAVTGASVAPLTALPIDMGDGHSLMIDRMQNTRQSILSRPATSSPSQRSLAINNHQNGSLTDYLQTKSYQETSLKLGGPLSRASRVYQQRVSQSLVQDLAVSTLGAQSHFASGFSTQTRPSMVQTASVNHQSFADSVVGKSKLSFDASPVRTSNQRVSSMTVSKVDRIPASPRKATGGGLRLGLSLGISSPPARRELHTHSLSPHK